jgi:hypothetical protein
MGSRSRRAEQKEEAKSISASIKRRVTLPTISRRNRFGTTSVFLLALLGVSKLSIPADLSSFWRQETAILQVSTGLFGLAVGVLAIMFHFRKGIIEDQYQQVEAAMNDREFLIALLQRIGLRTDDETSSEVIVRLYETMKQEDGEAATPAFSGLFSDHQELKNPMSVLNKIPDHDVVRLMLREAQSLGLVSCNLKSEYGQLQYFYRLTDPEIIGITQAPQSP